MPYTVLLLEDGDGFIWPDAIGGEKLESKKLVTIGTDGKWYYTKSSESSRTQVKGLTLSSIAKNKVGEILLWGLVGNPNWAFNEGAEVYASNILGELTETPPEFNPEVVGKVIEPDYILFSPQGIPRSLQTLSTNENQWEDMQVTATNVKIPSVDGADFGEVNSSGKYLPKFESGKTQSVRFVVQLSHRYKPGTDLEFHIHYEIEAGVELAEIKWVIEYAIGNVEGIFSDHDSGTDLYAAPIAGDRRHQYVTTHTVDGTGLKASVCLYGNLKRLGITDAFTGDAFLVSMDPHFKIGTVGTSVEFP